MKQLIMGKNCVKEVLKHAPERIITIYTSSRDQEGDPLYKDIRAQKIDIRFVGKKELENMVNSESHQGIVASVKPRKELDFKTFFAKVGDDNPSVVLVLDSINDPQNLGAILRAGECFGIDGVVWSKNRGADLTPVVTKASVGASELLDIIKVSNLADAVRKLKEAGYQVVTAEVGKGAVSIEEMRFSDRVALIMGSEGKGVQPLLSKLADAKVYIPMRGQIDSLNVSQATAVFLSWLAMNS